MILGVRVLHIWDTAGVAGNLATYFSRNYPGVKTSVLYRRKYDPFFQSRGIVEFIGGGPLRFHLMTFIKSLKYNILHFHALDRWLGFYKAIFPDKLLIIHYHGSHIRGKWEERRGHWRHADHIIVSTPDLLEGAPERAEYIPNMMNVGQVHETRIMDSAFHVKYGAVDLASELAEERGLGLMVWDRDETPLRHSLFLKYLARHEFYIDIRRVDGEILRNLSLTALEALALGSKVINWEGQVIEELPEIYEATTIAERFIAIYLGES